MVRPGVVYGSNGNPSQLVARISAFSATYSEENVARLVFNLLEDATEEVRHYIRTRGVKDGVANGQGRIDSEKMLKSVTFETFYNKSGRIEGKFGYLNSPPKWALWQEYGTYGGQGNGRGILAMLALTDAYRNFRIAMEDLFQNGLSQRNEGDFARTDSFRGSLA